MNNHYDNLYGSETVWSVIAEIEKGMKVISRE